MKQISVRPAHDHKSDENVDADINSNVDNYSEVLKESKEAFAALTTDKLHSEKDSELQNVENQILKETEINAVENRFSKKEFEIKVVENHVHKKLEETKVLRIITPTEELFLTKAAREELDRRRLPPSRRTMRLESTGQEAKRLEETKDSVKKNRNKKSQAKEMAEKEQDETELANIKPKDMAEITSQIKTTNRFGFIGAWFEKRRLQRKQKNKFKTEIEAQKKLVEFYDIYAAGEDILPNEPCKEDNSAADVILTDIQQFKSLNNDEF